MNDESYPDRILLKNEKENSYSGYNPTKVQNR